MTRRPRHPKPDANQQRMVQALRQCGLVVVVVSDLPGEQDQDDVDTLDMYVGDPCNGNWMHVECKTDGGELTPHQRRYLDRYGQQLPIVVARRAEDVLAALGRV